jgi:hypothetical protein
MANQGLCHASVLPEKYRIESLWELPVVHVDQRVRENPRQVYMSNSP